MRMRIEVNHVHHGHRRDTVLYVEHALTDAERAAADPIVDRAVEQLQALDVVHGRNDALTLLLCVLVEQTADVEAYERVAAERGVLAL